MSVGDFAGGLTQSISDYLTKERDTQRKREDEDLAYQQELIKALINRPDVRPEHLSRAIQDMMDLSAAKGSKRKQKSGNAGFMGQTETPVSQLLQAIGSGSTPIYDAPMPEAPTRAAGMAEPQLQLPQAQPKGQMDLGGGMMAQGTAMLPDLSSPLPTAKGPQPTPMPSSGASALMEPIPVPPKGMPVPGSAERLVGAAQQMQQYAQRPKPLLYTPDEMAQREGHAAGVKAGSIVTSQRDAEDQEMMALGASKEQIREARLRKMMGTTGRITTHTENWIGPDGKIFTLKVDTEGNMYDSQDNPVAGLDPALYHKVGISSPFSNSFIYDDAGRTTIASTDRNTGTTNFTPATGIRGRTSPGGPVVVTAGPGGTNQINRLPRQGTGVSPVTVPSQGGGREIAQQPLGAADQTSITQNLTALSNLRKIQEIYNQDPSAYGATIGPAAGRIGGLRQMIPLVPTDPRYNELQPYVSQFTNMMIKAITGAQMSEPEATRLKGQLPQMTDKPEVFDQKLKAALNNIAYVARAYIAKGKPIPQELADAAQEMGIQMPATSVPAGGPASTPAAGGGWQQVGKYKVRVKPAAGVP